MTKICIIGGGISGLSIARKKHEGNKIKLLESSVRIGGVIEFKGGRLFARLRCKYLECKTQEYQVDIEKL